MKLYKVHYYYWSINRYGDKDFSYISQWVSEETMQELKTDSHVDGLGILETKEVEND